ncbi:nitroreductase [Paenibacillus sp. FSL R7-277]|uniref:nitroreductase family protein n=1 Tax=Paenibacillus sp. FSL R7-277 TaxID=1227352 RepID=UPI0003E25266|nr:nitroreductase family protein [Paenibacillus sp. FSL R7-277]ETT77201.1 nitroreductase [Paenibacillus sp. FSL R7-277]
MSLQDIILQRKSVRHYDPNYAIERKEILDSIELAAKSPNGNNIQSTRYLLIEDKELRAKVRPIAYNQEQVETSSYLILILGDYRTFHAENIHAIQDKALEKGYFTQETKAHLTNAALGYYRNMSNQDYLKELVRDGSLAAMALVLILNEKGYQTITMSGYDKDALFKVLKIPQHYEDIMLLSVGRGIQEGHSTVRHDIEDITFIDRVPS